ncbi:MAG: 16S rRNA (guanine(527)-N(7))-methyltransferase RsmG [Janthinobacterium lividum]
MAALSEQRVAELLQPYLVSASIPDDLYVKVITFLELLLKWNARTNLTAVREPEQLLQRQIGESLFAGHLLANTASLLDVGSGAGFPGIPLKLLLPRVRVTLAESQGKKASFLREAARVLELDIDVWPQRVEVLPPAQTFEAVTMRAVDNSGAVLEAAGQHVAAGGSLLRYVSAEEAVLQSGWSVGAELPVPLSRGRLVRTVRSSMFHVEHDASSPPDVP